MLTGFPARMGSTSSILHARYLRIAIVSQLIVERPCLHRLHRFRGSGDPTAAAYWISGFFKPPLAVTALSAARMPTRKFSIANDLV